MIFKQVDEIIREEKWQTRRMVRPGEIDDRTLAIDASEWPDINITIPNKINAVFTGRERDELRVKWHVGREYAVVYKRGLPTVHVRQLITGDYEWTNGHPDPAGGARGWFPLRIVVTALRQEPLQAITENDAVAEGIHNINGVYKYATPDLSDGYPSAREAYAGLWNSINKQPGQRWQDNPQVWVITFDLWDGVHAHNRSRG